MQTGSYRLVDRYSVLGGVRPLVERVPEIVPRETRFVVLDLDRTVHLGITLGEILGWEILSDPRFRRADDRGVPEPFFAARRPVASSVNFVRGLRDWGLAGLMYATTVRLGDRWARWDELLARHIGVDYVDVVQSTLRNVLMARAASYSGAQLEVFADRAWRRSMDRLVIDRGVVDRIRAHCPELEAVILSSASTAPTVAHAAAQLGVDAWISSGVEVYEDSGEQLYTRPASVPRWLVPRTSGHLSRPGAVFHNSSVEKVRLLHMHHPRVFAADAVTVGISDNNFGEDRLWPDYFTHAVALNSRHPFSPFVGERSPCRSITVVDAATVGERPVTSRKLAWHGSLEERAFEGPELAVRLGPQPQARLCDLTDELRRARARLSDSAVRASRRELVELRSRFTSLVDSYNGAVDSQRAAVARELRRIGRRLRSVQRQVDRSTRECAMIHHALEVHRRHAGLEITGRLVPTS